MPKVSILIACYNVSKYIPQNIDNVLGQTLNDIEIVLVNDGSTDNSGELCDQLAKQDDRIKVVHKPNGGLGSARNAGLDIAGGDYIYFCDIDDRIELDLVERMYQLAIQSKAEMVIFGIDIYDIVSGTHDKNRFEDMLITSNGELKAVFCDKVFFKPHGNGFVCNKFYKRDFIEKNKFRFGCERIQQDEPFNLRLYQKVERVLLTSQSGYHYYFDTNASTGMKYVDRKFEAVTSVFDSLKAFYYEWGLNDKRFLDAAYSRYKGAILNVACYNYFHKDCPLTNTQKRERIRKMCLSPQFEDCSTYLVQNKSLDLISSVFWRCLCNGNIRLLMFLKRVLIITKRILK